jgi:hypothetical protein
MSDPASWEEANNHFLATALTWLRLRLLRHAPDAPAGEAEEAAAGEALRAAAAAGPPPALVLLSRQLGLSRFEQDVLLLCAAMEYDPHLPAFCAQAARDPGRPYPTFALALRLFDEPAWDVLSPERPLRYWRLLEVNQPGHQPLTGSPLRADERIVNYLKGLNYLDDRLALVLSPLETDAGPDELSGPQGAVVESIVRHLEQATGKRRLPVLHLLGADTSGKQLAARHAAARLGLHVYRLPADLLPGPPADLDLLARLWQRESLLLPLALYLDAHEAGPAEGPVSLLNRFLARGNGVVFLDTRDTLPGLDCPAVAFDLPRPTAEEQRSAWAAALGPAAGDAPGRLAGQFDLGLAAIRHLADAVRDEAGAGPALPDRLWDACLLYTRPRLDVLAQRLEAKATWEDIVLPAPEVNALRQLAAQVGQRSRVYDAWGFRRKMNRGLGISVLFAGESGTGKTMAAEVLANALRLNLHRIDLSAVVSKYIGETEKNLRRVFDAAEEGGAILFFDEADALFGKRSEVKDSHDRYANIEVNYLLQRMEAYRGLAILATNQKSALDPAFLRRLRFLVNFPFPGVAERRAIWERVFPEATPREALDLDRMARLNLTGGSIHNVALNAAFLAAQAGIPVTMPLLLDAARAEFRKLERPVNEADFRWQTPAGGV